MSKKHSVESDTMKAFMYLADKPNHRESDDVINKKFPNAVLKLLRNDDQSVGFKTEINGIRYTQLTIQGIALANEIRTNNSVRFFNKAAFVISIISLCISVGSVVAVFLA